MGITYKRTGNLSPNHLHTIFSNSEREVVGTASVSFVFFPPPLYQSHRIFTPMRLKEGEDLGGLSNSLILFHPALSKPIITFKTITPIAGAKNPDIGYSGAKRLAKESFYHIMVCSRTLKNAPMLFPYSQLAPQKAR